MSEADELPRRAFVEQVMGMPVSIHVRGPRVDDASVRTAVEQVWTMLRRVDDVFSTWRPDSQLMRRRRGELPAADAHPWLAEVDRWCEQAQVRTAGLFSATASPSGELDPTGLVKGWAVEKAADLLAQAPGVSFCVNAGGDLAAGHGRGATASTWRVGIEDPRHRGSVASTVALTQGGLATSGNAARGTHIMDPRDGRPVQRDGSVTVWGPSLMWADVWATALFVDPAAGAAAMAAADPGYESLVL